jgi:hypothetical protein
MMIMNSINIISPYKYSGQWVFDDASVGLIREAFVAGADDLIGMLTSTKDIENPGFNLLFSDQPFPGYDLELKWDKIEPDQTFGGN